MSTPDCHIIDFCIGLPGSQHDASAWQETLTVQQHDKLLEKEILFQSDLEEILGKRPFEHRTTYDEFVNGPEGGNQEAAAGNLVHEGVVDHSGTFDRNPEEKEASSNKE